MITQAEEMVMAFEEGRQPVCVHCGHKLDKVLESQYDDIMWKWTKNGRYYKRTSGDSDKPYHDCDECKDGCGAHDPDFTDNDLIYY